MYFLTYGLGKTWLDKCLQSPVPEDPSTSNMVNGPTATLPYFAIRLKKVQVEKISVSEMLIPRTVC